MRRRHLFWIALCMVFSLCACMTTRGKPLQVVPSLDTSKACAQWQWIGIKSPEAKECPAVQGWSAHQLFGPESDLKAADEPKYPQGQYSKYARVPAPRVFWELNRFCVYEKENKDTKLKALPFPPAELVRLDQDCAVISPSAGMDLEAQTRKILASHFLAQVGRTGAHDFINQTESVRLVFLDTQPTGDPFAQRPGTSRHGYDLAQIARQMVCDPGEGEDRCAARIRSQLALPFETFDPKSGKLTKRNEQEGGLLGTWNDLAVAIKTAVDDWLPNQSSERLILNLSVAWNPRLSGGIDQKAVDEMRAGTQAVYWALRYASGYGALVVAAAGNQNYGPDATTGPLLPAGWEGGVLDEESCRETTQGPLLYAVGGVQSDGYALANARRGGLPRRVAYADHAVVASYDQEPTAVYTGSSIATAVVSSIAAVVWNSRPGRTASEVMEILDRSGDELNGSAGAPDLSADFWFGAKPGVSSPRIHRLSLCSALREADCATDSACRARFHCEWNPERPFLSPLLKSAFSAHVSQEVIAPPLPAVPVPCKAERIFYQQGNSQPPICPSDEFSGIAALPWLFPQPQDNPCPSCVVIPPPPDNASLTELSVASTTYRLLGVVPQEWNGCLVGVTLDIDRHGTDGRQRVSVAFPSQVCARSEFDYTIDIGLPLERGTTAILSYVVQTTDGNKFSVQSPVLLAR